MKNKNTRLAINIAMIAVGMLMMAYAFVPLYKLFCQVTGFGGTPQMVSAPSDTIIDRDVEVFLDANADSRLGWEFKAVASKVKLKVGENKLAFYTATNNSGEAVTGRAVYNVTPEKAAIYFNKVECFCFINQTLQPGQKMQFPLSFFIDPEFASDPMMDDVKSITLSYTFYRQDEK